MEPALLNGRNASLVELIADRVKSAKKSGDIVKVSEYNHIPVCRRSGESRDIYLSYYPPGSSASPFPGQSIARHPRHALEAYFIKNGRLIVIGLYTASLKGDDEKAFYSLLDSLKLIDTSSPITSFDHYSKGRAFFIAADYRKAVVPLATALELEEKQRQLDLSHWRDLVEMAAISLGNLGDIAQAKKVFEYAAATDPAYPAFHLWLARYYTSVNDLDNTIVSLQKAFAGEEKTKDWAESSTFQRLDLNRRLPDPLTDPSFKRFVKDDKFRKAVKAMVKDRRPNSLIDLIR
jgi:tetratricopeptide (TPR) repeat protein